MAKHLQVTISGAYNNSKRELVDFDNVVGIIPFVDEDLAKMHVRGRYASMWIKAALNQKTKESRYPDRIDQVQLVYIDKIEEVDTDDLPYIGKDVKEMDYEDLQDLATAFDLRRIPLHKGASLREMRALAYVEYAMQVLGRSDLDVNDEAFNFAELPELVVGKAGKRRDQTKKVTNEEVIEGEEKNSSTASPETTMTLEDLEQLAKDKKINVPPSVRGNDEKKRKARHKWLYKELYGSAS